MEPKVYRYLLAPAVLVYWMVCFAPYNWVPPLHNFHNDAYLEPADGTLHFGGQGLATIPIERVGDDSVAPNKLFLSLSVQCEQAEQSGPARLVSLSNDTSSRHFMLGQQGTALVLRWRRPGSDDNGSPSFAVESYFSRCEPRQLELSADGVGLVLKSEGTPLLEVPSASMELWVDDYPLRLGNEGTWDRGWVGNISNLQLQIDGRWVANGWNRVQIPQNEWLLSQRIKRAVKISWLPFYQSNSQSLQDNTLNVIGFLPFGALLALAWSRRMTLWIAAAISALLSLSIEVGQLGFDGRVTSTTDLVTNTVGAAFGFLLINYLRRSET